MSPATFSLLLPNTIRIPKPFIVTCKYPETNLTTPSTALDPSGTHTNDNTTITESNTLQSTGRNSRAVKAPTAPWMKGPIVVEENQMIKFSNSRTKKTPNFSEIESFDKGLFSKVGGGRGKQTMKKILKGIDKLHGAQNSDDTQRKPENIKFKFSPGELFGEGRLDEGNEPEKEGILVDTQNAFRKIGLDGPIKRGKNMPWEKDDKLVFGRVRKDRVKTATELNVDGLLLERLRSEAKDIQKWVNVKKAGVTQAVVDQVHLIWKNNELAMLKFDLPLIRNMERAREIVEMKTGGFVVWGNRDALVVYRGSNYQSGLSTLKNTHHQFLNDQGNSSLNINSQDTETICESDRIGKINDNEGESLSIKGSLYEREADRLFEGLGPRFVDWWGRKPLPVDADLLPEVVSGFKPPFRLCPPGVRLKLTDKELTQFRMDARSLPTHFVLGRNRKIQGLAVAILKLWEKCHTVKIALKWGVPNTDNEQMANEIKSLTGGTLLLRNKYLIIVYRGKDFLPPHVANLVVEREFNLTRCQHQEETARLVANEHITIMDELPVDCSGIGTLSEFQSILSKFETSKNGNSEAEIELQSQKEKIEKELQSEQRKLFILRKKIQESAKELGQLNIAWRSLEPAADQEVITGEERVCLRMIGLKMQSTLVLGRRGVFDGVIEGMHQHWKHREVVKVVSKQRRFSQVMYTANMLTAECGGILVSVDKLKEGHAIIIYRGKNYNRPPMVLNKLPNKRDALRRSLLMQRIGSLKFFASEREQAVSILKGKLRQLEDKIGQI